MPASDTKLQYAAVHNNNHVVCAIDIRIGGDDPVTSDLLEVVFLPLNHSYRPHPVFLPFHMSMRPSFLVNPKIAKLDSATIKQLEHSPWDAIKGAELLEDWWERIRFKEHKYIMPLCFDYNFVKPWLQNWLGPMFKHLIHESHRDLLSILNFINDRDDFHGEIPRYKFPTLAQMATRSNVEIFDRNNLMANVKAYSDIYRYTLLQR